MGYRVALIPRAFLHVSLMCWANLSFASILTPKYFTEFLHLMFWLLICNSLMSKLVLSAKWTAIDFEGLIVIFQFVSHFIV